MPPRTNPVLFRPFICPSCLSRPKALKASHLRRFTTSPQRASNENKFARLTNRSIVRLTGPDAALFLHNLIPAKLVDLGGRTAPIYTAFLSAQGRILHDVFIYPPSSTSNGEEWFIEVDETSAGDLMKHLKKHKLRAKFTLERIDPEKLGVYHSWSTPPDGEGTFVTSMGGQDPRPGMGVRWLEDVSSDATPLHHLKSTGSEEATLEDYTIHRMLNGIAEGQPEIVSSHALPQESNLDLFRGIDFLKGCYLGQELTIHTHHTGVVRKRILPCQLYQPDTPSPPGVQEVPDYSADNGVVLPPPGSNISKSHAKGRGRSSGKWLGGVGNIGLALCRLEMMTDIQLTAERTNFDPNEQYKVKWEIEGGDGNGQGEVMLRPFVPKWLREGVEASLRRKEKKKPQREEDEDEEEIN